MSWLARCREGSSTTRALSSPHRSTVQVECGGALPGQDTFRMGGQGGRTGPVEHLTELGSMRQRDRVSRQYLGPQHRPEGVQQSVLRGGQPVLPSLVPDTRQQQPD